MCIDNFLCYSPPSCAWYELRRHWLIGWGRQMWVGRWAAALTATILIVGAIAVASPADAAAILNVSTSVTAPATLGPTPTPTIEGTPYYGLTLNAHPGVWGPGTVGLAYQWSRSGQPVPNATYRMYQLSLADMGKRISVTVTATKPGYLTAYRTSIPTAPVTTGTFTATTSLTVTGNLKVGETLTMHLPTWSLQPDHVDYGWRRDDGESIAYNVLSYVVTAADLGHTVTARATAFKAGYTNVMEVEESPIPSLGILNPSPTPTIVGSAQVGQTLTVQPGLWGPQPVALTYRWNRDGSPISGAISSTYLPSVNDVGTRLTVTVNATKADFATATRTSAPTSSVLSGEFAVLTRLTITGTPIVRQTLTMHLPTWSPMPGHVSYGWKRGTQPILGTSGSLTYTLTDADDSQVVTAYAVAESPGYTSSVQSVAQNVTTSPLVLAKDLTVNGGVGGIIYPGQQLTISPAAWNVPTISSQYSWRGGTISATGLTYTIKPSDEGKTLTITQRSQLGAPYYEQVVVTRVYVGITN